MLHNEETKNTNVNYDFSFFTKINYPFFLYPGTPFKGYVAENTHNIYIEELRRLESCLCKLCLETKSPILFHLTIGSPMEEAGVDILTEKKTLFQMHQLIPDHLLRAGQNGITVVNFVVCPNNIVNPLFMITKDFRQINSKLYEHNKYPITIHFFNTLMPTKDKERNDKFITHFGDKTKLLDVNLDIYKQSDIDRLYVDEFYKVYTSVIKQIIGFNGFCSCFSFAVFNDDTQNRKYNNCVMFKEILKCYSFDHNNTLLCEWIFRYDIFIVCNMKRIMFETKDNDFICYVPLERALREEVPLKKVNSSKINSFTILIPKLNDSGKIIMDRIYYSMK
jgi:hypothetical protein